jgi:N-acetyl-gamma-glutamyl-phosphate reductase
VTSRSSAGRPIDDAHAHLAGFYSLAFDSELNIDAIASAGRGVVFCSLPHGASAEAVAALAPRAAERAIKLIDLSGAFRLEDEELRRLHYPETAALNGGGGAFPYGLTELNAAAIAGADCVANPGCLATACALAVAPLVGADFAGSIVFDAKTGTSGAGANPQPRTHHPTRHASVAAYGILEHRHEPEIRQALGDAAGARLKTSFVPHLLSVSRGIYATAFLELATEASTEELLARYDGFYRAAPFVRVRRDPPELRDVVGSNFCDVTVRARERQVVAMAAIDNLVKGMAGAAIQNMNLMHGLPETTGLWSPAFGAI